MDVYHRCNPVVVAACLVALSAAGISCTGFDERSAVPTGMLPTIRPDYSNSVIPPNIAPLNFTIRDSGERFAVVIGSVKGPSISLGNLGTSLRFCAPSVSVPGCCWVSTSHTRRTGPETEARQKRLGQGPPPWLR